MTKQVKIYAGSDTYEKWQQICQRFSSNTAAFAVVVENYFNQISQEDTEMEEKSNRELMNFVVSNGRVIANPETGLFKWASLGTEIEFEATKRGWDADEIHDAIEWAFNTDTHDGH